MSSKSQRSAKIIDILKQNTTSTTKELATALGVSEMTVRRDIAELAKKKYTGYVLRRNCLEIKYD